MILILFKEDRFYVCAIIAKFVFINTISIVAILLLELV